MFPIGPNPTWSQLKKAIAANPMLMLKEWSMPPSLQNPSVVVAQLFCKFTMQIWLMLNRSSLKGIRPAPTPLYDAMKCWTAASIDQPLFNTTFKACNISLENEDGTAHGCDGPQSMSLSRCMEIYFSSQEVSFPPRKDSQWSAFWSKQGYIKTYHQSLEEQTTEESFYLVDSLETIFAHLQCLPVSQRITKKSKGYVWRIEQGSMVFHTNSRYYKIEHLSKESKDTRRPHGEQIAQCQIKSRKVFEEDLWHSSGLAGLASKKDETDQQKRHARLQRLSMTTKNRRKPPKQGHLQEPSLPSFEDDEDEFGATLTQLIGLGTAHDVIPDMNINIERESNSSDSEDARYKEIEEGMVGDDSDDDDDDKEEEEVNDLYEV